MKRTEENRQQGFTIVELLVVIAVLVVLAALIFAGASSAVRAAKGAACANNLRQMGTAIFDIQAEGVGTGFNGPGTFPPYSGQISEDGPWRAFHLYELVGEKAGYCEFEDGAYRWTVHPSETFLQNPLSEFVLLENAETASITNEAFRGARSSHGGFGYNHLVGDWVNSGIDPLTVDRRTTLMAEVVDPSLTILMAEQNPNVERHAVWMGPYLPNRIPKGTYKDSVRCLFIDGHVEVLKNDVLATEEGRTKYFQPEQTQY